MGDDASVTSSGTASIPFSANSADSTFVVPAGGETVYEGFSNIVGPNPIGFGGDLGGPAVGVQTNPGGSVAVGENAYINAGTSVQGPHFGGTGANTYEETRAYAADIQIQPLTTTTATSATLIGTVNAQGATTTAQFQYSTDPTFTTAVTTISAVPSTVTGSTDTAISASLNGLAPGTTYYYRAVASSTAGNVVGSTVSFNTQAIPAINWTAPTAINYGSALSAAQLNATSPVSGTFRYTANGIPVNIGSVLPAGSYTLAANFTPNDPADYATNSATEPLVVNAVTPAVNWSPLSAITYGTTLSAAQLNATSPIQGAFSYTVNGSPVTIGSVLTAGSHTIVANFTPADTTDYATNSTSESLLINKATPVITWAAPTGITYGTKLSAAQLDASTTVSGNFTYSPASNTYLNAGQNQTLRVTFRPSDTADYNSASGSTTINVAQAPLQITANSISRAYGTANPTLTASYSGFVHGDSAANLTTLPVLATSATSASPVVNGGYPITVSGAAASNYNINYTNGTLTVFLAPYAFTQSIPFGISPAGASPYAAPVFDANGNLFGTTLDGGTNNVGTVYEIAKGSSAITTIASFNTTNGSHPRDKLTVDSAGDLFGTTYDGGTNGDGSIFEIVHGSNTITPLASFNSTNGANPFGGVVFDSSGNLWGTTYQGGANGLGTLFELTPGATSITPMLSFDSTTGAPETGLAIDSSGTLYGTTIGTTGNYGTVFKLPHGAMSITPIATFNPPNGEYLQGDLVLDPSGNIFGTTSVGGTNHVGTIFEIAHNTTTINTLASFNTTNGADVYGGLTMDAAGNLFGVTGFGGANNTGTVFEVAKGSSAITSLASFTSSAGYPTAGVAIDPSGNIWGTTSEGGSGNNGTVYELASIASTLAFTQPLGTSAGSVLGGANGIQVAVENSNGTIVGGDTSTVTIALTGGTFAGGGTTRTAAAVNGVATFGNLTINSPGNFSLSATDSTFAPATSSFTITPGITSTTVSGASGIYGQSGSIALSANVSTTYTAVNQGTVTFTVQKGQNTVATLTSGTVANGVASVNLSAVGLSAGSYTISATYNPAASNPNFATSTSAVPGTLLMQQVTPAVTWATPAPILFAAPLTTTQLNAAASVQGSFAYAQPAGTVLPAGTDTISVLFTPADSTDYTSVTATVQIIVNPNHILMVTNTSDSGDGSLRQAILNADSNPGADTIQFAIPGSGIHTISPLTPLPQITDSTIINGETQTGYSGAPLIEINGASLPSGSIGLDFTSSTNTIEGLTIDAFSAAEIDLESTSSSNVVAGNYIGTNTAGSLGTSGNAIGILVSGSSNTIGGISAASRNIISGNSIGIELAAGSKNLIEGNYIGTNVTGTFSVGNSLAGIKILDASSNNTIGAGTAGASNFIAFNGNGSPGSGGVIIGDAATGTVPVGNALMYNSIFSNNGLGISLGSGGANNAVAAPTIGGVTTTSTSSTVSIRVYAAVGSKVRIELYSNPSSAAGQGKTLLIAGSGIAVPARSPGQSYSIITATIPALKGTQFISTTLTDATNDTSVFSSPFQVN